MPHFFFFLPEYKFDLVCWIYFVWKEKKVEDYPKETNPLEGEFTYPLNSTAATILSLLVNWKSKRNNEFIDLDPQFIELLLKLLPIFCISLRRSSTKQDWGTRGAVYMHDTTIQSTITISATWVNNWVYLVLIRYIKYKIVNTFRSKMSFTNNSHSFLSTPFGIFLRDRCIGFSITYFACKFPLHLFHNSFINLKIWSQWSCISTLSNLCYNNQMSWVYWYGKSTLKI